MHVSPDYHSSPDMEKAKIFQDKIKFKQYLSKNTALHKMLEGKHQIQDNIIPPKPKEEKQKDTHTHTTTTNNKISGINKH